MEPIIREENKIYAVGYRKDVLFLALEMTDFQMQVKLLSMLTADIALRRVNNEAMPRYAAKREEHTT